MTRPVSVALVISAPGWRGSVASFAKVAEGLVAAGHRACFVTAHATVTEQLRARGHQVEELAATRTGPRELWRLRKIFRRHQVTASYADMPRDLRLAALAGRLVGAGTAFRINVNAGKMSDDIVTRLALRSTGAVIVQSAWAADRVRNTAPAVARRPMHLIHNGYDGDAWRRDPGAAVRVRERLGLAPSAPLVLCASVFAPHKRQDFVIEALERGPAGSPRPTLLLAGGVEEQAPFLARARASTLDIRFLGRPGPDALRELYSAADVVAQPAMNEAFGNVICEAMCCEAAVVVPDAGSAPEQVGPEHEGAGVIVAAEESGQWGARIAALVGDPERRAEIGQRARARVLREFPVARMQAAHTAIFETLSR